MKILVRLPNWLGDMVMSVGFVRQLPHFFEGAEVSVIAKKGIHDLLDFFPPLHHRFIFHKPDFKGLGGALRFGKEVKQQERFDLFFSLPNSMSAALSGFTSGSRKRIGYKNELRQILLTHSFKQPQGLHRADEYIRLLELFTGKTAAPVSVTLNHAFAREGHIAMNINSEASSRRLTQDKAVRLISEVQQGFGVPIVLVGAPKEKEFVQSVIDRLDNKTGVRNAAGATSLHGLVEVLASAQLVVSTDSGPAHLANALGTPTVVLFGAGNEAHTAPYNPANRSVIRLGQLSCEPCLKNTCVRYGIPQCLERLDTKQIIERMHQIAVQHG